MPYSFGTFDEVVKTIFRQVQPKNILDIGCGAGKYGSLAKAVIPNAKRIGIEVEEQYVKRFNLRDLYHEVRVGTAQEVLNKTASEIYDLVIFGDSIEHMPKSMGLDLLNFLTYRSQYILILAPEFITQHAIDGVAEEAHISVWSEADFTWHDLWAWDNAWVVGLFLLRGYFKAPMPLEILVNNLNKAQIPLTEENSTRVLRNAHFNIVDKPRLNDRNEQGEQVTFRPR